MSDQQSRIIQNYLTVKVAIASLTGNTEEIKNHHTVQDGLTSSIRWNIFLFPLGIVMLDILQSVVNDRFPGNTVLIYILTILAVVLLVAIVRNAINKSIQQIRYYEVANTTRIIANYINEVGDASNINLAGLPSNQDKATDPIEENQDKALIKEE